MDHQSNTRFQRRVLSRFFYEVCCGGESDDPTTLGDLSSALFELKDGEGRGEVRSLRVSDSEAGAVEVPTTTVVNNHV
jgi:hypothetical protein